MQWPNPSISVPGRGGEEASIIRYSENFTRSLVYRNMGSVYILGFVNILTTLCYFAPSVEFQKNMYR